jgi:hypothetical protein
MSNASKRNIWFDEDVYMVRHDNIGMETEETQLSRSALNCIHNAACDTRIPQSEWTTECVIKLCFDGSKTLSGVGFG